MKKVIQVFLMVWFLVAGGTIVSLAQVSQPDPFIVALIDRISIGSWSRGIPVYDVHSRLIGELISIEVDGVACELLFYKDTLIAFGQGEFLRTSYVQSEDAMKQTLNIRFGGQARLIERRLTMIHPLMFIVQGSYRYQGKIIDDLILRCNSSIFTLKSDNGSSFEWIDSPRQIVFPLESHRVSYQVPSYQYYLSDFSTCVLMLSNYWRSMSWIKTGLHPEDARYFLVNLHLMMQDVEMLKRKCQCEDDPISVADILRTFIKARGGNVKIEVWEANPSDLPEKEPYQMIKALIGRSSDQPFLMELSSRSGERAYAILNGYAQIPQGEFLECIFPTSFLGEKTYQRYFFKWYENYGNLKIYQIMNPSGSENL